MGPLSSRPAREAFYGREVQRGPSEGVETFLGRAKFEEASANYLLRCLEVENVAPHRQIFVIPLENSPAR
jgi:hypothetical protein